MNGSRGLLVLLLAALPMHLGGCVAAVPLVMAANMLAAGGAGMLTQAAQRQHSDPYCTELIATNQRMQRSGLNAAVTPADQERCFGATANRSVTQVSLSYVSRPTGRTRTCEEIDQVLSGIHAYNQQRPRGTPLQVALVSSIEEAQCAATIRKYPTIEQAARQRN